MTHKIVKHCVFVLLLGLATNAIEAQNTLSLSFGAHQVVAMNADTNSTIVFFGEQIEPRTFSASYFHGVDLIPVTAGSATFDIQRPIPRTAVWIAVDMTSGKTAVGLPPGSPAVEYVPDPDTVKHNFTGNISKLDLPFLVADVLLVRPGEGAWRVTVADGSSTDGDHLQNGRVSVTLETLALTEKDKKPPKALKKGDVLVIIAPRTLRYAVIKVKE